jgi:dimeric dUTPase (all-alpha-NTP-PPase superfamily)
MFTLFLFFDPKILLFLEVAKVNAIQVRCFMMVQAKKELTSAEIARNVSKSIARLIVYIVLYVAVSAFVKYLIADFLPRFGMSLGEYEVYVQILLALAFGFLIASAVASFFYWSTVGKYGHPTAAAIRNVVRFVGIGGMLAAIAGGERLAWRSEAS